MTDCDLWVMLDPIILRRGHHALQVVKVKGHCTFQQAREYGMSEYDVIGNRAADATAARGSRMLFHGDGVRLKGIEERGGKLRALVGL
eukprot:1306841-Alexandrium_andersonii.AAC.1